jgi:hypothetical protein
VGSTDRDIGRGSAPLALGVALLAFCILITWRAPFLIGPGLDPSWIEAAKFAAARGLTYGRDFIFTYGPYHHLATRAFDPQTYPQVLFYDAFAVTAVFWVGLRNRALIPLAALAVAFVFLQERGDSLFALTFFAIFLIALQRRDLWGLVFAVVAGPLLLSKLSLMLVLIPLLLLADVERAIARRAPVLTLALLGSIVTAYLAAGQPLTGLPAFLGSTLEIILGYGGAMQIEGPVHEVYAALAAAAAVVVAAVVLAFRNRGQAGDLRSVAVVLGLIWTLYVLFKMGFVRQDGHTAIFHGALPAVLVLVMAWFDRPQTRTRGRQLVFAGLFLIAAINGFCWQAFTQRPSPQAPLEVGRKAAAALQEIPENLRTGVGWITGRTQEEARRNYALAAQALKRPFPPSVSGTVDAIPWELSQLIVSGLEYRGRPVVQSYSAYTPGLQARDLAFFEGPKAPDTLFLRVEDIDGRLPSLALGPSLPVIGARYDAAGSDPLGLILKRRATPRAMSVRRGGVQTIPLDSWAPAPGGSGRLVMARIELKRSLVGRLAGFLLREPVVTITLRTASGREAAFRFVPGMAEHGVGVSPLPPAFEMSAPILLDPAWAARGEPVTALKLGSKGRWAYQDARIAFDEVQLEPGFGASLRGLPLLAADIVASDVKRAATFNGKEIFAHASTVLRAVITAPIHLKGVAGLHAQPAGTKPGNGVEFIMTKVSPAGASETVLQVRIPPNGRPAPFDVRVEPGGVLQLETRDLGNTDFDWSYWGELELVD